MDIKIRYIGIILMLIGFSGSAWGQYKSYDKAMKYYKEGNLYDLMKFSKEMDPDEISFQFKIYGKASMEYGFYDKAWKFYQKTALLDSEIFNERDVLNYYYCLLKSNNEEVILQDSLFDEMAAISPWVSYVHKVAGSRDFYRELKFDGIKNKEIETSGLLPQYGVMFNDDYIYYAFDKNKEHSADADSKLKENLITNLRWQENTKIGKARLNYSGGIGREGTSVERIPTRRRVVTFFKAQKSKDEFFTVVPGNGAPEEIYINGDKYPSFPFNSTQYACAMPYLDEQKSRLYFSSTMQGGIGGWDIYYSDFDGLRWGEPVNAGDRINTPYDELFPAFKDSMLFFSSDGREGLGGFDNYVYNKKTGKTINLFPVNTPDDDLSFQIAGVEPFRGVGIRNKETVYFSSSNDFTDLYSAMIDTLEGNHRPPKLQEIPVEKPKNVIKAIETIVEEESEPVENFNSAPVKTAEKPKESDQQTSMQVARELLQVEVAKKPEQKVTSPPRTEVKKEEPVVAENRPAAKPVRKPAQPVNLVEDIVLPPKDTTPFFMSVPKQPLPENNSKAERMGEIYFDINSPVIKSTNYDNLNQIVQQIKENDIKNIVVWGHADRSGTGRANDYLSFLRAMGVVEYMKNKLGDDAGRRIFTVASGEKYARGANARETRDRKVVVYSGEVSFPYRLIFAHKAEPRETLESIAELYNNDLQKLKEMNGFTRIPEDRIVLIGIRGVHVAKAGETLFGIAQSYNCDVNVLRKINLKENNTIAFGEKLFIPFAKN